MEANDAASVSSLRLVNVYGRGATGASQTSFELPRPIGPADADKVDIASIKKAASASKSRALVAATVDAPVNFQQSAPSSAQGTMPFYRHPADQNSAATGVALGRTLDVEG